MEGVAVASPVLEAEAGIAGTERTIRLIGIDPLRAGLIQPAWFADDPARRLELLKQDKVLISAAAHEFLTTQGGAGLKIVSGVETVALEVAGVLPAASLRGVAALTDVATAQWRLRRLREPDPIRPRLAPGPGREAAGGP